MWFLSKHIKFSTVNLNYKQVVSKITFFSQMLYQVKEGKVGISLTLRLFNSSTLRDELGTPLQMNCNVKKRNGSTPFTNNN